MFTLALFSIAMTWKQPKFPSTDEQIKKPWYIQWNITQPWKEQILISSGEVDEPRACYTEWSKSEREKQISYINIYGI